ncbi:hypothetical protein [uncultured Amnibacterium sp.]|uniref:hypothetical protein n=1 Tax=uncultured Amnibacterium sp. TaxID=1631851 RepID=UPI0035CAEEA8
MVPRASRPGVALLLGGVLVLFVSVIAQLATTDGFAETLWVAVSVVGACVVVAGVVVLLRHHARSAPPED